MLQALNFKYKIVCRLSIRIRVTGLQLPSTIVRNSLVGLLITMMSAEVGLMKTMCFIAVFWTFWILPGICTPESPMTFIPDTSSWWLKTLTVTIPLKLLIRDTIEAKGVKLIQIHLLNYTVDFLKMSSLTCNATTVDSPE